MLIKYTTSMVAKDFGRTAKEITEILAKFAAAPKSASTALDERQLSLIFEYLTQNNQVESIESIFADVYHEPKAPEAAPAPAAEEKTAPAAKEAAPKAADPQPGKPAAVAKPQQAQPAAPAQQRPTTRVPEKRVVDTRKGGNVNLDKYDEKLERIASSKTRQMDAGREKFRGRNAQKRAALGGNKRKQGGGGKKGPPPP